MKYTVFVNGGPAFPATFRNDGDLNTTSPDGCVVPPGGAVQLLGMSLRDYFAAHAPKHAHSWFAPNMPPLPQPEYFHDHPNEQRCRAEFDCRADNAEILSAYDDERRKQYELQWPYAWADAMLAEREKGGAS